MAEYAAGTYTQADCTGGCDKEIVVELANAATGQKATFKFLYIFGKTRIDAGAVN